ncbi:uncharacterized protein LOC113467830 [Diaphorina citri]|uniref:Uncharacterized protein LOC113467830 n=1 Tax=Diaphorina citri TaxID=121845 RepID=A0A3Q0IUW7_DIACI|nr:uncharacterized protein LOC113467830 [Diaphorina citri]
MGSAKLQESTHTMVHYYDLQPLLEELDGLNQQFKSIKEATANKTHLGKELENYNRIVSYLQTSSQDKINTINFSYSPKRTKRAFFPQIGSIVKTITGNLDSTDAERYDLIIQNILKNENNIQKQLDLQYTFNNEAVKRFELTVQNIQHNEEILRNKILQLGEVFTEEGISALMIAEDAFHQLVTLYSSLLSILQDVENSLTFCRAKIYHPSILRPSELHSELEKLKSTHGNKIPLEINNISDLQKLLNVDCRIENSKIIYFISFPINQDIQYDLYFLKSIPSLSELGFTTVIPKNHYFLKSGSSIKPLNDICEQGSSFQCFQKNVVNSIKECERQILQGEKPESCKYVTLEINENHIDFIPQINMFIVVFPHRETIKMEFENEIEIKELQGIYLIESNQGNLIFRNQVLKFLSRSKGKPTILSNVNVRFDKEKLSNLKIRLEDLNLNEVKLNQLIPNTERESQSFDNSVKPWKMVNLFTFFSVISLILIVTIRMFFWRYISKLLRNRKLKQESNINMLPTSVDSPPNPGLYPKISLPGDAKF